METFDVAIVGGGSTGLAALKHLSDLGKQAVLIEAGPQVGTKNVSGGILYSKRPRNGKVHNVEDVYGRVTPPDCSRLPATQPTPSLFRENRGCESGYLAKPTCAYSARAGSHRAVAF